MGIVIGLCALLVVGAILFVVLRQRKEAVQKSGAEVPGNNVPEQEGFMMGIGPWRREPERAELM